jgi:hypothetical protein
MSRLSLLLLAAFAVVFLSACCSLPEVVMSGVGRSVTGSGNLVTLEQSYEGFKRVNISHAFKAEVTQGDTYSVVITVDDNLEQYLDVRVVGDTLQVGFDRNGPFTMRNTTMRAQIIMPELTGITSSGASQVRVSGFSSAKDLRVDVSGASTVRGQIDAADLNTDVSGASRLELAGQGKDGNITVSGASQANLGDFRMDNVTVEASGASRAEVYASGRLDAEASGASTVLYSGDPTLGRTNTSGASTIRAR